MTLFELMNNIHFTFISALLEKSCPYLYADTLSLKKHTFPNKRKNFVNQIILS